MASMGDLEMWLGQESTRFKTQGPEFGTPSGRAAEAETERS